MRWFKKRRRLKTSPVMIAASLYQMAERNDPQIAPEAFYLPESINARFREKVFLYREANILLALFDRLNPPSKGVTGDPLLKPVLSEYARIIFEKINTPDRHQSVTAAVKDLNSYLHPPMGSRWGIARDWSRNWFASIGHDEINPAKLERFSQFWFNQYAAVQNALEVAVTTSRK